jgi:hypothetical protein
VIRLNQVRCVLAVVDHQPISTATSSASSSIWKSRSCSDRRLVAPRMASDDEGSRRYIVVGLLWLLTAVYLGASGRVAAWRPPLPQIVLAGLTLLVLVAVVALARFRRGLRALDLRWLVAFHLTRFVGIYFLVLYYRDGALPYAFAVPGGWGDVLIATLHLPLSLLVTFLVPLIIADHVVVFWRVIGRAPSQN